MELDGLKQAPFNTTLLGVVRGVADYFAVEASDAMLFGATGHAFLINIHEELCPSGPYCWKRAEFSPLLRNLGIEMVDHGFFSNESSAHERERVESILRDHLDRGIPCSLMNMENQLITGYDEAGFLTAQPWAPHADFPPAHLTYGTWSELKGEVHINFYTFGKVAVAQPREAAVQSLVYAVDLFENPGDHTSGPYGMGPDGYDNFIAAVKDGAGSSHGNWWNATVWSECRRMAGDYMREVATLCGEPAQAAGDLAVHFATVSEDLDRVSDKEMKADEKVSLLADLKMRESAAVEALRRLADDIRSSEAQPA